MSTVKVTKPVRALEIIDTKYKQIVHYNNLKVSAEEQDKIDGKLVKAVQEYIDLVVSAIYNGDIGADPYLIVTHGAPKAPKVDAAAKAHIEHLRATDPNVVTKIDALFIAQAQAGNAVPQGTFKNGVKWKIDQVKNVIVLSFKLTKMYLQITWNSIKQLWNQMVNWFKTKVGKTQVQETAASITATQETVVAHQVIEPAVAVVAA